MTVDAISPEERERILRHNWWAHDGRWYLHVARELGFQKTNEMNKAVNRAVGKLEMKNFLAALGLSDEEIRRNALDILKANLEMVAADVFTIRHIRQKGDRFSLVMDACAAHSGTVRAGYAGEYQCACYKRSEGWLEAMGLDGRVRIVASLLKGDNHCELSLEPGS